MIINFLIIIQDIYEISIDTEDHTYLIKVSGTEDTEEWERFLNLDA